MSRASTTVTVSFSPTDATVFVASVSPTSPALPPHYQNQRNWRVPASPRATPASTTGPSYSAKST